MKMEDKIKQILKSYTYDIEKSLWYENKQGKQISKTLLAEIYELGFKEAQKELLEELNKWRIEITSKDCESHEEVEILNYELEDWIEKKKLSLENNSEKR